jgi:hypothetical protein
MNVALAGQNGDKGPLSNFRNISDQRPIEIFQPVSVANGLGEFETYLRNNCAFIPKLRRAVGAGRSDQHGVRGIDHQPGSEPTVCEEAVDAAGKHLLLIEDNPATCLNISR